MPARSSFATFLLSARNSCIVRAMCEHQSPTPAERIIAKLGGAKVVATVVQRARQNVERWKKPRAEGGTGGLVPAQHQVELLRHALVTGADLELEDFFPDDLVAALKARRPSMAVLSHAAVRPESERKP